MPLVSVIIPTYNRAIYVTAAIDSVLAQTFTDYEIIVVDDGSTDDTKKLLQPYLSIIHYIYQENKGVSAARNTGILAAQGKWLAFLDSDDIWLPEKLNVQINDINENSSINVHVVNAEYHINNSITDLFSLRRIKINEYREKYIKEPLKHFLKHKYASLGSFLIKKEIINNNGYLDESLSIYEDFHFLTKISFSGKWFLKNIILAKYFSRKEYSNIRLTDKIKYNKTNDIESLIYIYNNLIKYIKNNNLPKKYELLLNNENFNINFYYYIYLISINKINEAIKIFKLSNQINYFNVTKIKYLICKTSIGKKYFQI